MLDEIYMLLAGWEVRIVKNCDLGLENAARGRRPTRRIPLAVAVRMGKFRPLQEPIRLQDLLNSARSRAEKKII